MFNNGLRTLLLCVIALLLLSANPLQLLFGVSFFYSYLFSDVDPASQ